MDRIGQIPESLLSFAPMAATIVVSGLLIWGVRHALQRRYDGQPDLRYRSQWAVAGLTLFALLIVIVLSPLDNETRGQLIGLIGLLISAAIALSSTTFVGNAMAGLMLRTVSSFRPGDFVRVGDHFGRVTERGLFHVELQTEDRDLITLPNLFLVTSPVRVVRESGSIVTAEVSLGYDVPRATVEPALLEAAGEAGLEESFVHIIALGDFSILYRVSGLLKDVKGLLSARSRLRSMMLDRLHAAGIEIVSPSFMNTRAVAEGRLFLPEVARVVEKPAEAAAAERIMFDKADEAESQERLVQRHAEIGEEIKALEQERSQAEDKDVVAALKDRIESLVTYRENILAMIEKAPDRP